MGNIEIWVEHRSPIPSSLQVLIQMSNYNPFKSAVAQLSTPEAIAWYKSTALETAYCFGEGIVTLAAATLRAGQLFRLFIHVLYETILEASRPAAQPQLCLAGSAPIALLPALCEPHPDWQRYVRRQVKTTMVDSRDWAPMMGDRILVTPVPKKRRGGRKAAK